MSLKLIAPFAGLIGTIASVVGVSTSNQRSEKSANTDPTHKWTIEKEEIVEGLRYRRGVLSEEAQRSKHAALRFSLIFGGWNNRSLLV